MCYDPWEYGIHKFASLYVGAVDESLRTDVPDAHRRMWGGRVEGFASGYVEKLRELDGEELTDWIEDVKDYYEGGTLLLLLNPAEEEEKRRTEETIDG